MVRLKYDFRQQVPETLDIYLYSDVEPAYTDWWTGERQDEGSTEAFRRQLDDHPDAKRINLYVNSYGGDVKEGYGICGRYRGIHRVDHLHGGRRGRDVQKQRDDYPQHGHGRVWKCERAAKSRR